MDRKLRYIPSTRLASYATQELVRLEDEIPSKHATT